MSNILLELNFFQKNLPVFFDEKYFSRNLDFLMNCLSKRTISDAQKKSLITKVIINNDVFFYEDILEILIRNYNYLIIERIINEKELQELYFESSRVLSKSFNTLPEVEKRNTIIELISDYFIANDDLPPLIKTLIKDSSDELKLELRDRLVYVSTMGLLDSGNPQDIKNAKRMLARDSFENIVEQDNEEFKRKNGVVEHFDILNNYRMFDGIKVPLYEKLNGINSKIFSIFIEYIKEKESRVDSIEQLERQLNIKYEYVKSPKLKSQYIKNAIVAIILSGLLKIANTNNNLGELELIDNLILTEENIRNAVYDIIITSKPNPSVIKAMLKIDPYSFDFLRSKNQELMAVYWQYAKRNNYYFTEEEAEELAELNKRIPAILEEQRVVESYEPYLDVNGKKIIKRDQNGNVIFEYQIRQFKPKEGNDITDIVEYINNEIGISKIPESSKGHYLEKIRYMARKYVQSKNETELFEFLRGIDLYLRSSNESTLQRHDSDKEITALAMFDPAENISQDNRLLYTLYNLNQIAHSTTERNLLYDIHHRNRLDLGAEKNEKEVLITLVNYISELMQYGLSFERILEIAKGEESGAKKLLSGSPNDSDKQDISGYEKIVFVVFPDYDYNIESRKKALLLVETLKKSEKINYLKILISSNEVVIELNENNYEEVVEKFKYLHKMLNPDRKTKIKNYAEERFTFFETKRIIADELIAKFTTQINDELINVAFSTKQEKIDYYKEHGLIIEIQSDVKELKSNPSEKEKKKYSDSDNELIRKIEEIVSKGKQEFPLFVEIDDLIVEVKAEDDSTKTYTIHKGPVLVCYSEEFNETFSIHLKDLKEKYIKDYKNLIITKQLEETIANTKLRPPGLSIRKPMIRPETSDTIPEVSGTFVDRKKNIDYSVSLYNYFTYDVERIKYHNIKKLNKIKKILNELVITPENLIYARKLCEELISITEEEYYKKFVDNPSAMPDIYKKVFGKVMPNDIFELSSLHQEIKQLYNKILFYLVKYRVQVVPSEKETIKKGM